MRLASNKAVHAKAAHVRYPVQGTVRDESGGGTDDGTDGVGGGKRVVGSGLACAGMGGVSEIVHITAHITLINNCADLGGI